VAPQFFLDLNKVSGEFGDYDMTGACPDLRHSCICSQNDVTHACTASMGCFGSFYSLRRHF